jgi:PAS domain S-box-containing protein
LNMISVLYVDDEPDLLHLGKIFLEETGDFRVDTVRLPEEVLSRLDKDSYDAIVCDYQMPGMTGIALLKEVRAISPDIPFILFTGRGREEVVIEAINNGADFYLQKGSDTDTQFAELASKLHQAVTRRQAERSLRASEKMLADIINFLPDATFAVNRSGIVIAWNRAIEEMTGVPAPAMIGKGDYEYAIPFYGKRQPILINMILETGAKMTSDYSGIIREKDALIAGTRLAPPQGVAKYLTMKASPLYNDSGEIIGAIESIRDITDQKLAEEELFRSRQMLQLVFDNIPQRVFWKDTRSAFLGCNKALAKDLGHDDPAELIGKTDYDSDHPELADHFRQDDLEVMESGQPKLSFEEAQIRPDGSRAWLLTNKVPLRNQEGTVIGVLGTYDDITARKKAEDELKAAHEQLTTSDEELRQQYDELSHAETSIRKKEEQLREIANTIPGVVFQFYARPDGTYGCYYVSERARDILGMNENAADFFLRCTAQIHPDDRTGFQKSIREAIERSEKWFFEGRFVKPDGEMIWTQAISSPTFHENELVFSGVIFDISDRKDAEDALKEEGLKYQTLVEHSQDAVFIVRDGDLVFANKALFDISGYSREQIIGQPFNELIAPEDRDMVMTRSRDRQAGKTAPESYEFSLLQVDGKTRRRIKMNAGLAMYGGKPAIIGTFHDITCEWIRDDILQKSEQKYRELAELLPQIVFEMDTRMNITYANNHAFTALGATREDLEKGINALDYIDPSQHQWVMENTKKLIAGESYESPEYTIIRKDKSRFPVLIYSSPIYHDQKLTGFRGVMVDISAWKSATKAQKVSEEQYRSLAEAAQDMIYIIDKNDTVVYVNSYTQQMLGKKSEEIVGKPRSALFKGPVGAAQYNSLQRVFTTGQPERIESQFPLPGRETWHDTHLVPLKNAEGTITAVLAISRDIAQLKQAQGALKRSNEKLNLLNSITRHDVANQLTILHGYIQLAMMKEQKTVVGDFLQKIDLACDKIQRQIEFTRTYQDLGIKAPDWFRIDQILEKTKPEGIVFTSLCRDFEIFADPMLEKVFFNIFDNAIRHGERVTSMNVRCVPDTDHLTIVIEDDGIGIPLDEKQKIFQKGFGRNTGYGLFLVREILAITDMEIHETGKHGSGARFEIRVPKSGFKRVLKP